MIKKICKDCGNEFCAATNKKRFCDGCIKKHHRMQCAKNRRLSKTAPKRINLQSMPVIRYCRLLDKYNYLHKTKISYGQSVAMLNDSSITKEEFFM